MTKVVFETATIADAIKKADRIAPSKGTAFDKAAGIVLTIDPGNGLVVVRATDLKIFSTEWVTSLSIEGEKVEWRVPSKLFATVLAGLPIGSERTVSLEDVSNGRNQFVQLISGRTKAKFNLMQTDYYPVWDVFNPDDLFEVDDFGGRIAMVEWAASKADDPPLSGVHFDGNVVKSTDQYRLAVAPLPMGLSLPEPITVPAGILGSILKQTGEVQIGLSDDGLLQIMPEPTVQIMAVVFGIDYPNTARIEGFRDRPNKLKLHKAPLLEIMRRASAFAGTERFPILRVFLGREEVAVMMDSKEVGVLADVMEVPGYCDHKRVEMRFGPSNIIEAIENAPNDMIHLGYDMENSMSVLYVDGGSGYEAWVMPRKGLSTEGASG